MGSVEGKREYRRNSRLPQSSKKLRVASTLQARTKNAIPRQHPVAFHHGALVVFTGDRQPSSRPTSVRRPPLGARSPSSAPARKRQRLAPHPKAPAYASRTRPVRVPYASRTRPQRTTCEEGCPPSSTPSFKTPPRLLTANPAEPPKLSVKKGLLPPAPTKRVHFPPSRLRTQSTQR